MNRIIYISIVVFPLSIIYFGIIDAGNWLIKQDESLLSDAIVVLMGSVNDRILHAMDIYEEGWASRMIMVETASPSRIELIEERGGIHTSNTMQSRALAIDMGFPPDSIIILQGGARSTLEEFTIILEYLMTCPDMDTLIIVSSADHMRRASIIINTASDFSRNDLEICCQPSVYSDFCPSKWWKNKEDIQAVSMEYLKLAHFFFFEKRKLKKHFKQP